jgi:hypothetical protein
MTLERRSTSSDPAINLLVSRSLYQNGQQASWRTNALVNARRRLSDVPDRAKVGFATAVRCVLWRSHKFPSFFSHKFLFFIPLILRKPYIDKKITSFFISFSASLKVEFVYLSIFTANYISIA